MPASDHAALLDVLDEPAFLLTPDHSIARANRAARRTFGEGLDGQPFAGLVATEHDRFAAYLGRCSGTAQALPGSIDLRRADGAPARFRTQGARVALGEGVFVALRCIPSQAEAFPLLGRKIAELHAEIRERRVAQAALEEALRNNEVLLRELHHRVKNNIQMIVGLLSSARRDARSEEARRVLQEAGARMIAIGAVQQLMHQSQEIRSIQAAAFIHALCDAVEASFGGALRLRVAADEGAITNEVALPLALIMNELLTNAFKHASETGGGCTDVSLRRGERHWELVIHDDGPGLPPDVEARRASGLGLVRGLCRQIGAAFETENRNGLRCSIRFDASD
jgi:two-component sensor histidine kinase